MAPFFYLMKIGVVSDTHNNLRNVGRIVELFNEYGVDRVVHTGDITQAKTLDVFAQLDAPMWGVYGNNDQERESVSSFAVCSSKTAWQKFEIVSSGVSWYLPLPNMTEHCESCKPPVSWS